MAEIIVSHPAVNADPFRNHTAEDTWLRDGIVRDFIRANISVKQYPLACDISAGNAYAAFLLNLQGWNAHTITCIDLCKPDRAFVQDASWKFWDLDKLGDNLAHNATLPNEVAQLAGKFDIAMLILGGVKKESYGRVLRFLLRVGGIACAHPYQDILRNDKKHWRVIPNTQFMFRKIL